MCLCVAEVLTGNYDDDFHDSDDDDVTDESNYSSNSSVEEEDIPVSLVAFVSVFFILFLRTFRFVFSFCYESVSFLVHQ